jgi:spermidine synthase
MRLIGCDRMSETVDPRQPVGLGRSALAFAFVGSACLLVLEIVAGRLVAPRLGVSLYTWTSVIGVVLAGVSLGNYLGGRLADRRPTRSTLGLVYLAAAAASVLLLGVLRFMDSLELPDGAPALLQVLWVVALLFLLPSIILGAPTPLLTRLSLQSVEHTGRVVGRIQAAASLGSIVGTFLTGFFLISAFGTRHVVVGVAAILLVLAVVAWPPWRSRRAYAAGSLAAVILVAGWLSESDCTRESDYYCIRVDPGKVVRTVNGRRVEVTPPTRSLFLDALIHSEVNLRHPSQLLYGYEQQYARVIGLQVPAGGKVDAFFIGGGGYVFPRWLESKYRGQVTVAEVDPAVTGIAREYLGLRDSPRLHLRTGDARRALRSLPASTRFDAIFGDAFDDFSVPYHLTTREFNELVASHLEPNGVYLLNVVDGNHHDFLRSEVRTLRRTFPYVAVVTPEDGWPPPAWRSTYVVMARKTAPSKPLDTVPVAALDDFFANGHSVVLTDDHAPVEQLLAPVFREALKSRTQ